MKKILRCLKPFWVFILFGVVCIVCDAAIEMYLPLLMADIVSTGIQGGDTEYIIRTGITMGLFSLGALIAATGNMFFSAKAGSGFGAKVRKALFDAVQRFSFKNIDQISTASLSTRLTNDVRRVQETVVMGLRMVVRVPVMLIFALVMAIQLNAELAKIFLVVIPLLFVGIAIIAPKAMPFFSAMQNKVDNVNRDVQENVTNVRVVKSFVREDYENEKFASSSDALLDTSLKAMNLVIIVSPIMMFLMNMSIVAVIWIGGNQVINGIGDAAQLSAFINYILHVLMSVMMVAMLFVMLSRASASFKRVSEVLNEKVDLTEKDGAIDLPLKGNLEFDNVSFKYSDADNEMILKDISFSAKPGQLVAIIGGTGAGKSTLVHLIPRLYDVSEGSVKIDGHDVRDLSFSALRRSIGVVLQKNTLFSGTIKENLKWGDADATDEEIIHAAECAQIHAFIDGLPDKYDTNVEQGGVNFSGGQKQRLCIARAMLKKPALLILDDSTSAVDTATEAKIKESFSTELKNTTTLLIAQRISSVIHADKIIVLDDGKIVGEGTHGELLKSCAEYQEIYASQTETAKRGA